MAIASKRCFLHLVIHAAALLAFAVIVEESNKMAKGGCTQSTQLHSCCSIISRVAASTGAAATPATATTFRDTTDSAAVTSAAAVTTAA